MTMIDIKNLEKLTPEQRMQFNNLLENFPHLESKLETSRELNTQTEFEESKPTLSRKIAEDMDYSNFITAEEPAPKVSSSFDNIPKLKIDPTNNKLFSSFDTEQNEKKELTQEEKEARQQRVKEQQVKNAVAAGQPEEVAKFNPEGKVHPILHKLRATMGLRSLQKPVEVNVGGCRYAMKALDRRSLSQATVLALTTTSNPTMYQANLDTAIISHSVVAIDGVPLKDIFEIPYEEEIDGKSVTIADIKREQLASEAFYTELLNNPNELTEYLVTYYQQEFPQLDLLTQDNSKFICPVGNCLQTRIGNKNETFYCPIHGEKLAKEELLPNPL